MRPTISKWSTLRGVRALLLVFVLEGCTTLTPAGERVRLVAAPTSEVERSALSGCRYLGTIAAHATSTRPGSPLTGNFAIARSNAQNQVRNDAAKAGADTVVNLQTSDGYFGVDATGDAYDCGLWRR
jgi:hypothetical protein